MCSLAVRLPMMLFCCTMVCESVDSLGGGKALLVVQGLVGLGLGDEVLNQAGLGGARDGKQANGQGGQEGTAAGGLGLDLRRTSGRRGVQRTDTEAPHRVRLGS